MPSFRDCNGKEWLVRLDAPTILDVKNECNGLFLAAPDGSGYEALQMDDCLLVDAIWIVCREQATAANINQRQFGQALVGDPIDAARDALLKAILDFFPSRRREVVKTVGEKNERMRKLAMEKALAQINDPAMEQQFLARIQRDIENALTRSLQPTSSQP